MSKEIATVATGAPVEAGTPAGPAEQLALLATPPDARDVSAELAAPPRRKLPWLSLVLAGGVIATGAFAGGVWFQQNHGSTGGKASARPAAAAAAAGGGYGQNNSRRGGQGGQGQGQGGQPGFARGTVKAVDGTTVYLTDTNGNTIKVTTGDATKVQLNKEGKVADLLPGQSVTVVGTPDADGGYTAGQLVEGAGAVGGFGGGSGAGMPRNPSGG
ncbi:hypothetical protein [Kitasatospora sp. NPDC001547]|uniref:hypothetical protein n=1 Tax=Kitasatospora sp. NPDC001547 TaxID=3364015 RepID=UPI0036757776|nr:hypothetical protein KitaXyl93_38230 [Kitasatospora sp. Xyl93]